MERVCYLNGSIIPLKNAKVGVYDLGILRGFGVYDGLTSFSGKPFHFKDHWKRFRNAARALGLAVPYTAREVERAMTSIIARNAPGRRANLRMVLTGGKAEGGLKHVPGRETFFMLAEPAVPLPKKFYTRGADLISHEHTRLMPEIKTTNYITAVMHQKRRAKAGAIEILYTNGGRVLECATSNVFMVKNGVISTPATGILKGVTRNIALKLARGAHPVKERTVTMKELCKADEVFITGSFKDIVPIVSVDGHTIGSGKPGPVTRDLMERFVRYAQ